MRKPVKVRQWHGARRQNLETTRQDSDERRAATALRGRRAVMQAEYSNRRAVID
jgi:hypothetical protein